MNASSSVERAKAYLDAHLQNQGRLPPQVATAPFVTISRETGSGGTLLAEEICRRMNRREDALDHQWTALDRDVVERVLENHGFAANLARYLPEDRVPEIQALVGEIVGLHPNVWSLVQQTGELMRRLALSGHVVLVGRGANFATATLKGGLHLRLVGSVECRTHRLIETLGLTPAEALVHLRRTDSARADYVRTYHNHAVNDPLAYDLTINTDHVSLPRAAQLVAAALGD